MTFEIPKGADNFYFGFDLRDLDADLAKMDPYVGELADWPAHITGSPPVWQVPHKNPDGVFRTVQELCARQHPMVVQPIRDAYFGSDGSVPVTVFDNNQLYLFHYAIMGALTMNNYAPNVHFDPQYAGESYNPHSSHIENQLIPRGPLTLSHLSLFRKLRGRKFVQERYELGTKG